jgi:hypothetical protein
MRHESYERRTTDVAVCGASLRWKSQLVSHRCGLASVTGHVIWDLLLKNLNWGRFSTSTSASPVNSDSSNCSVFINHFVIGTIWKCVAVFSRQMHIRHESSAILSYLGSSWLLAVSKTQRVCWNENVSRRLRTLNHLWQRGGELTDISVQYKYYVSGRFPSSRFYLKRHKVSETGFCLRLQVKSIIQ